MTDKRNSERVDCLNNCQLTYNGEKYEGILENISNTGASIKLVDTQRITIPEGSQCSLVIGNDTFLIPGEFSGTVIYNKADKVGVQFQF